MYAGLLCLVVVASGTVVLRSRPEETSTAVRVDSPGLAPPSQLAPPEPQGGMAEAAASISLAELARQARSRSATTTSTTRPRVTTSTTRPKSTTTTTAARAVASTTTTPARPSPAPAPGPAVSPPTTTPLTPLTTLVEAVVPPAAGASKAITKTDSGVASWFRAPAATCAHRTLPMGTAIKVTRTANGTTATCKVDDRGPTVETGRLIDLSLDTFEKLADRGTGLIDVTIEW